MVKLVDDVTKCHVRINVDIKDGEEIPEDEFYICSSFAFSNIGDRIYIQKNYTSETKGWFKVVQKYSVASIYKTLRTNEVTLHLESCDGYQD